MAPLPGDFVCLSIGGAGGWLVGLGERLDGSGFSQFEHAGVLIDTSGTAPVVGHMVQAEPGGANVRALESWHPAGQTLWSSGKILLTDAQRTAICAAARGYIGTPYSWLDYMAIAAHRFRLPVPGLRAYIESTGHMICSELVDRAYQAAGVHLFDDNRWNGYVTPADLAGLIEETR